MIVSFVDTGGIVDHRYLEVIVSVVDTGGIVDHRYLEVIVSFVDTGGIVDHRYLEVIGGISLLGISAIAWVYGIGPNLGV